MCESGGAHSATQITPTTIMHIAMCSVPPGVLAEHPFALPRAVPAAPSPSAGCTTTSGASSSATTCSGQPSTVRKVPNSHRVRRPINSHQPAQSAGSARSARSWRRTPGKRSLGCRAVDEQTAAAIPSARSTMDVDDHRSRTAPIAGALATGAAGRLRSCRRWRASQGRTQTATVARPAGAARDPGPHPQRPRFRAHLRRRTAPRRAPRRCSTCSLGRRCRRPSSSSASRSRYPLVRQILAAGHEARTSLRPPPLPAATRAVAGARGPRARRGLRSGPPAAARSRLYRPPYGVLSAAGARDRARARVAHAAVEPLGPGLGGRCDARAIAVRVSEGAERGRGAAAARRR